MIKGKAKTRVVTIDDRVLLPKESQKVFNHSPDGFSWGYQGSGPAQLALAILLYYHTQEFALKCYQDFKREVIAAFPQDRDFKLTEEEFNTWVDNHFRTKVETT